MRRRKLRLVVPTNAACEGLHLQMLGTPSNVDAGDPSRLEQCLGRIKRCGQRRQRLDMQNLVYHGTQGEQIYAALSRRIKGALRHLRQPAGHNRRRLDRRRRTPRANDGLVSAPTAAGAQSLREAQDRSRQGIARRLRSRVLEGGRLSIGCPSRGDGAEERT